MRHSKSTINSRFTKEQEIVIDHFNNYAPYGLYATVIEKSINKSQVAEIWKYHLTKPLLFITPLQNDAVEVYDILRETYKSSTIQAALEAILSAEDIPAGTVSVSNARHPGQARQGHSGLWRRSGPNPHTDPQQPDIAGVAKAQGKRPVIWRSLRRLCEWL